MSINPTVVRRDDGGWDFTWTPGTSPYSIWLDGRLKTTVIDEAYSFTDPGYEDSPPPLEIVSDGDVAENSLFPPFLTLQWQRVAAAEAYIIERYNGATWEEVGEVTQTSNTYLQWVSPALEDGTTVQYRVKAVDLRGNAGTPITFSIEVCRNPAPPEVTYTIDSNGDVLVTEA